LCVDLADRDNKENTCLLALCVVYECQGQWMQELQKHQKGMLFEECRRIVVGWLMF
jgi:hypothetical protein